MPDELPAEMPKGVLMMIRSPIGRVLVIREDSHPGMIGRWMRLQRQELKSGNYNYLGQRQLKMFQGV